MKKSIILILAALCLSITINIWFIIGELETNPNESPKSYPYLSPRIFSENQNDLLINFLPLRKSLRSLVEGYDNQFSVYFEYLPTGTSVGIGEKVEFQAASLIKVPVVMAYFHQMERQGIQVNTNVTMEERDIDRDSGELWKKGIGATFSYDEIVRRAIIDSDNTAAMMLINRVSQEDFDQAYEGLDIDLKKDNKQVMITAKQYSSILKSLYFSSILSKKNSQYILDLLTQTKFNDKLPAGVPATVKVAHKIGILNEDSYMDCGIVYVPKRPYIVCMISKSNDMLATIRMQAVSKMIYGYISSYDAKSN